MSRYFYPEPVLVKRSFVKGGRTKPPFSHLDVPDDAVVDAPLRADDALGVRLQQRREWIRSSVDSFIADILSVDSFVEWGDSFIARGA